jgi:putative DNA primase/helicase
MNDDEEDKFIEDDFGALCEEFEKIHAKIINKSLYVKETEDEFLLISKEKMVVSYEHISFYKKVDSFGKKVIKKVSFIKHWMEGNDNIRKYDTIDIYPNSNLCPKNVFSLWKPFYMELNMDVPYTPHEEGLKFILNHIKILCDNNEVIFDYFIKWMAQMIQYPEVKSVAITLISLEGTGKGRLIDLFKKILGKKKVLETTNPSRDIWGDFNGIMTNAFLVNLNELKKNDTINNMEQIKGLITDPTILINNKGINQMEMRSNHRFIITTNNLNPIETKKDDRRNVIIRCSDEKIGDVEYFKILRGFIDDFNVQKSFYIYLKEIPDMVNFHKIPLPNTEHQLSLKEASRNKPDLWLEDFTRENQDKEVVIKSPKEILEMFNNYCIENSFDYTIDSMKLGLQLSQLKIKDAIVFDSGRRNKIFNIKLLKEHYKIDVCLI